MGLAHVAPSPRGSERLSTRQKAREVSRALFSFYCSALTLYSRTQTLLLLAHVTSGGRVHQAHEMHARGYSSQQIAVALECTHTTVLRWLHRPLPRPPAWLRAVLSELSEYTAEELQRELTSEAWPGAFSPCDSVRARAHRACPAPKRS